MTALFESPRTDPSPEGTERHISEQAPLTPVEVDAAIAQGLVDQFMSLPEEIRKAGLGRRKKPRTAATVEEAYMAVDKIYKDNLYPYEYTPELSAFRITLEGEAQLRQDIPDDPVARSAERGIRAFRAAEEAARREAEVAYLKAEAERRGDKRHLISLERAAKEEKFGPYADDWDGNWRDYARQVGIWLPASPEAAVEASPAGAVLRNAKSADNGTEAEAIEVVPLSEAEKAAKQQAEVAFWHEEADRRGLSFVDAQRHPDSANIGPRSDEWNNGGWRDYAVEAGIPVPKSPPVVASNVVPLIPSLATPESGIFDDPDLAYEGPEPDSDPDKDFDNDHAHLYLPDSLVPENTPENGEGEPGVVNLGIIDPSAEERRDAAAEHTGNVRNRKGVRDLLSSLTRPVGWGAERLGDVVERILARNNTQPEGSESDESTDESGNSLSALDKARNVLNKATRPIAWGADRLGNLNHFISRGLSAQNTARKERRTKRIEGYDTLRTDEIRNKLAEMQNRKRWGATYGWRKRSEMVDLRSAYDKRVRAEINSTIEDALADGSLEQTLQAVVAKKIELMSLESNQFFAAMANANAVGTRYGTVVRKTGDILYGKERKLKQRLLVGGAMAVGVVAAAAFAPAAAIVVVPGIRALKVAGSGVSGHDSQKGTERIFEKLQTKAEAKITKSGSKLEGDVDLALAGEDEFARRYLKRVNRSDTKRRTISFLGQAAGVAGVLGFADDLVKAVNPFDSTTSGSELGRAAGEAAGRGTSAGGAGTEAANELQDRLVAGGLSESQARDIVTDPAQAVQANRFFNSVQNIQEATGATGAELERRVSAASELAAMRESAVDRALDLNPDVTRADATRVFDANFANYVNQSQFKATVDALKAQGYSGDALRSQVNNALGMAQARNDYIVRMSGKPSINSVTYLQREQFGRQFDQQFQQYVNAA